MDLKKIVMRRSPLESHRKSAVALVRQRCSWLQQKQVSTYSMAKLEQRLRAHLHVLTSSLAEDIETEPVDLYDTAIWLASRLQSKHADIRIAGALSGADLLKEKDSPRAVAARWAFSLYRSDETDRVTKRLYQAYAEIRPTLIYIWELQGVPVPQVMLNHGELHRFDSELQAAVIRYAASHANIGVGIFHHYYNPLLRLVDTLPCEHAVLRAALWGGLLRGDVDALAALRRAIELQTEENERIPLLRLAALSGNVRFHSILQQHARLVPESGYTLLALWGHHLAIPDIIAALDDPVSNQYAADAWFWLTGIRLPITSRQSVVGEETPTDHDTSDEMANLHTAKAWWQVNKDAWHDSERRIFGHPMSVTTIAGLARSFTGKCSQDLLDLLALHLGEPLTVSPVSWITQRLAVLEKFKPGSVPRNPANTSSNMEHHHYA